MRKHHKYSSEELKIAIERLDTVDMKEMEESLDILLDPAVKDRMVQAAWNISGNDQQVFQRVIGSFLSLIEIGYLLSDLQTEQDLDRTTAPWLTKEFDENPLELDI